MHTRHGFSLKLAAGVWVAANVVAARAAAFPGCNNEGGPDLILGDLQAISNYSPVGTIDAFSVGTYSCNIGNANLPWIGSSNNHPVISQHMYRYKVVGGAGQFEQIGISWVSHAFSTLADGPWCPCNGQSGSVLGVGCADPYTSGRNGIQLATVGGLGPRFDINAHSGGFTWPYPFRNTNGTVPVTSVTRRVQVEMADLNPALNAGAMYYVEVMYVTPSDCGLGKQDNNATYRRVIITGTASNSNATMTGTAQRELPAIFAWPVNEAGVVLTEVSAPESDGGGKLHDMTSRLILGHKATEVSPGVWNYEYALYNMNSERSVDSFRIPLPTGVNVSTTGFHDVFYHSGDGFGSTPEAQVTFDGTDWPATIGATELSWDMVVVEPVENSNALRWGTMYNFRLTCNKPPEIGQVSLSQFKGDITVNISGVARPGVDCDTNNIADSVEIVGNPALDANGNGIKDACEPLGCDGDVAPAGGDGAVDIDDLTAVILSWGTEDPVVDIDGDGVVEIDDLTAVILGWGSCP